MAYWTVMVVSVVLRCPLEHRDVGIEHANKQALLASMSMNEALVDLLREERQGLAVKKHTRRYWLLPSKSWPKQAYRGLPSMRSRKCRA